MDLRLTVKGRFIWPGNIKSQGMGPEDRGVWLPIKENGELTKVWKSKLLCCDAVDHSFRPQMTKEQLLTSEAGYPEKQRCEA